MHKLSKYTYRDRDQDLVREFEELLGGYKQKQILEFITYTHKFCINYCSGCELDGSIYLVLDNSIIQSFKHVKTNPNRTIQVHAFLAFSRFVRHWSSRKVRLAISPAAIYEHMGGGTKDNISIENAEIALTNLILFLHATELPVVGLGFEDKKGLFLKLKAIRDDREFLTRYINTLDKADWKEELEHSDGTLTIPMGIAMSEIPNNLPLRYFDPWYVKFILAARVEQLIIKQSDKAIGSGKLSISLAEIITFKKSSGFLRGLGDIEMLQICDLSRQFKQNTGYVMMGQTVDQGLQDVLDGRTSFVISTELKPSDPEALNQIKNNFFLNPFEENERRGKREFDEFQVFFERISDVCRNLDPSCD